LSTTESGQARGTLTLILGGVRSGKSNFAQALAEELGDSDVLFVATAETRDEEMVRRVTLHRQSRPSQWRTLEQPLQVGQAIGAIQDLPSVVLLDCLTLLVSNVLLSDIDWQDDPQHAQPTLSSARADVWETRLQVELEQLLDVVRQRPVHLIVVSGEVGMGVVPEHALGRLFRDLLGRSNQWLATRAHETYFMVAGMPIPIAALATNVQTAALRLRQQERRTS